MGILFIIVSNIFAIYPAQVIRVALDMVSDSLAQYQLLSNTPASGSYQVLLGRTILIFGVVVLVLALAKGLFLFFTRQTIIVMSRLIEYDLKNEIYDHYQSLDLAFFKKNSTGDLMNRISEDVSRVRMYLGPAVMYTMNLIVLFILVIGVMLTVSPLLTFYVLLPLPLLSLSIYYVSNIINVKSERCKSIYRVFQHSYKNLLQEFEYSKHLPSSRNAHRTFPKHHQNTKKFLLIWPG